ncbi:MAG TPA: hypothetical protein ENN19_10780 [Chloroflexi bacterium]|nr:hypothetical protein [Chloroflexota bacterium]
MNEADKQIIKEAVYEVLEPFVARMAQDYEETRRWMERIEGRLAALEQRLEALEQRAAALEQRMEALEQRVAALEQRMEALERQVASLERRVGRLEVAVHELKHSSTLLEQRLAEKGFVESEAVARERWATFAELRQVESRVTQLEVTVFHDEGPEWDIGESKE